MLPIELKNIILEYILQLQLHDINQQRTARNGYRRIVLQMKNIHMKPLYEYWWFSAHISQRIFIIERFGKGLWRLCRSPSYHWLLE